MADELKACPFCGVVNTHMASGWLDGRYNEEEWFQVECQECCAAGPSKPFEYEAAEAWNNAGAGAATARAKAAEQRAEAWRRFAQEVASDVHPIGADPLGDITTDFLPVLLDITRRAAQQHGAATARAEAAEQRAAAAEAEVAQARAEGAAAERARIAADLREWAEQGGDPWMAHVADEVAAERRPGGDQ